MEVSKLKTCINPSVSDLVVLLDIDGGISGKPILRKATIQSIFDLLPSTPNVSQGNAGFTIPTAIRTVAVSSDFFIGVDHDTGELYKITKADLFAGLSSGSSSGGSSGGSSGATSSKLTGIPFGASPSYSPGREYGKAFDDDLTTIYDFLYPSGGFTGLDLGPTNTRKLTKVRIYPRQDSNVQSRSGGARIQGSNDQLNGYVDLFTFGSTPDTGTWYEGTITTSVTYRYIRYYGADNTYCNVSEVEFYGV